MPDKDGNIHKSVTEILDELTITLTSTTQSSIKYSTIFISLNKNSV